jgi:hypothetical protein
LHLAGFRARRKSSVRAAIHQHERSNA